MEHRSFRHWFVPSHHNDYHPHLLRAPSLALIALAMIGVQLIFNGLVTGRPSVLGFGSDIQAEKIIELTNQERVAHGLPILSPNPALIRAAELKAQDMFSYDYWAHTSPTGQTPWMFFKQAGYIYEYAGENLAKDFNTSKGIVAGWLASESHRANMLNVAYHDVGVAVVNGRLAGKDTTLVVAMYGAPSQSLTDRVFQGVLPSARAESGVPTSTPVTYSIFKPLPFATMFTWSELIVAVLLAVVAAIFLNDHRIKIRFSMPRHHHSHSLLQAGILFIALGLVIAHGLYGVIG